MIEIARRRVVASWRLVAAVLSNPNLRRLELGRVAATVSASGTVVVYVLLAYRAGGSAAVAALIVTTTWTAAVALPVAAIAADRFPRQRVIVGADAIRVVLLAATAAFAVDARTSTVIVLAALVTIVGSASSTARAALVPALAHDAEQLVAANAFASITSSAAALVGPAIAGVGVAIGGPELALVVFACSSVVSALAAFGIEPRGDYVHGSRERRLGARAVAGFRPLIAAGPVRLVVLLSAAQTFVGGILAVLLVAAVIDTLGLGETGPSVLSAALAGGTLLGSVVLLMFAERRMGAAIAIGLSMWGVAAALVGVVATPLVGVVLIALIGIGDTLADVSALTIVQRLVPNEVLARSLGVLRGAFFTLASLGSIVAPFLQDLVGVRVGLVAAGAVVPAATFALWPLLTRAAAAPPAPARELLRSIPFFAPLAPDALMRLATTARRRDVAEGDVIVRQGDTDRGFFVVASGDVEIEVDGRVVARGGRGEYFGEIASIRDSARTATVRALAPTELFFIAGDEFVAALSGDDAGHAAAEGIIAARLMRAV